MDNNEKIKEKIVVVKLYNGEFIIGKKISTLADTMMLKDPRSLAIVPNMAGSISIAITSVCMPFKSTRLDDMMLLKLAITEDDCHSDLRQH